MKDGRPKRGMDRDLALKVLALCSTVKDALDDLLDTMFIIYQPKYFTGNIGDMATFTVVAMNVASYQWQASSDAGETWTNSSLAGATTPTITVKISASNKDRIWRCLLTDSDGNTLYTDVAGIIVPTT